MTDPAAGGNATASGAVGPAGPGAAWEAEVAAVAASLSAHRLGAVLERAVLGEVAALDQMCGSDVLVSNSAPVCVVPAASLARTQSVRSLLLSHSSLACLSKTHELITFRHLLLASLFSPICSRRLDLSSSPCLLA